MALGVWHFAIVVGSLNGIFIEDNNRNKIIGKKLGANQIEMKKTKWWPVFDLNF